MEAKRSAIADSKGRQQFGRSWAGGQIDPPYGVKVINKVRASVRVSQPGSSQAGRQYDPLHWVICSIKSRASARASQPGSSQAGRQDGSFWTGGNQRNGVIAPVSLWQTGV